MGNGQLKALQQHLGLTGLPDSERATYFGEQLMMGWFELLCCPSAMGCTILEFEPKNPDGGEPKYKVKLRLSHSEHVPRYQLHGVQDGRTVPCILGHMEKTETHLRAKPGEFVRVQIWKLTCSSVVKERRNAAQQRKGRCWGGGREEPLRPSAADMQLRGLSIASQAKLDVRPPAPGEEGEGAKFGRESERWVETIGADSKAYTLAVEPPRGEDDQHRSMSSINVMRILHNGDKVCVARKQRFAGTLGRVEQPFLGVQIKPPGDGGLPASATGLSDDSPGAFASLLDTHSLMLLLMCLAWSEETMSPQLDMTDTFVQAMRADPGEHGSAAERGFAVQWDTEDVKSRLKQYEYAKLHSWTKLPERKEDPEEEFACSASAPPWGTIEEA